MFLGLRAVQRFPGLDPLRDGGDLVAIGELGPVRHLGELAGQDLDLARGGREGPALLDLVPEGDVRLVELELVDAALLELLPLHGDALVVLHLLPPRRQIGLVHGGVVVEVVARRACGLYFSPKPSR